MEAGMRRLADGVATVAVGRLALVVGSGRTVVSMLPPWLTPAALALTVPASASLPVGPWMTSDLSVNGVLVWAARVGTLVMETTADAGGESGVRERATSPEVDLAAGRKGVVRAEVKHGIDARGVTVLVIAIIMDAEGQQHIQYVSRILMVGRVGHAGGPGRVVHGRPGASAAGDAAAPGLRGVPSSSFSGLALLTGADAELPGPLRGTSLSFV